VPGNRSVVRNVQPTMANQALTSAVRGGCVGVLLLTGCGTGPARPELPPIRMTSHGGFDSSSDTWLIAADGSWTFTNSVRSLPPRTTTRTGRLTDAQLRDLAPLARDPALTVEMSIEPGSCTISDGATERLEIGSVRYLANWCDEFRPLTARIRARIVALTVGS
jgi:hypothetical protein